MQQFQIRSVDNNLVVIIFPSIGCWSVKVRGNLICLIYSISMKIFHREKPSKLKNAIQYLAAMTHTSDRTTCIKTCSRKRGSTLKKWTKLLTGTLISLTGFWLTHIKVSVIKQKRKCCARSVKIPISEIMIINLKKEAQSKSAILPL